MAKGIANGLPLGALVATAPVADSLHKSTISTFGGNPVSCAAANTVIDIVERDNLADHAGRQGERLRDGLLRIQRRFPAPIGDVRGRGLMQALELVVDETAGDRTPAPELTQALLDAARERGLLLGRGGTYNNVIRISPPLNVSSSEIDEALGILERAMAAVA